MPTNSDQKGKRGERELARLLRTHGYGAMRAEQEWLDARLAEVTPARFQELVMVFRDATRLEIDFWAMGLERRA